MLYKYNVFLVGWEQENCIALCVSWAKRVMLGLDCVQDPPSDVVGLLLRFGLLPLTLVTLCSRRDSGFTLGTEGV